MPPSVADGNALGRRGYGDGRYDRTSVPALRPHRDRIDAGRSRRRSLGICPRRWLPFSGGQNATGSVLSPRSREDSRHSGVSETRARFGIRCTSVPIAIWPSTRASGAPKTEMDTKAKGYVPVVRPCDVEMVGVGEVRGIPVGRPNNCHDGRAFGDLSLSDPDFGAG